MRKFVVMLAVVLSVGGITIAEEVKQEEKKTYELPDYTSAPFKVNDLHIEKSGLPEHGNSEMVLVETYYDTKDEVSATHIIKVFYILRHVFSSVSERPFKAELYPIYAEWTSRIDNKVHTYGFRGGLYEEFWYLKDKKEILNNRK